MADVFAGRFELLDPIGSGGAGTVWRAWDRRQERLCAAKVLRQRDAGALLRFVREQGRRLDHPNVLSPYGWAADDDLALLAMDLVGGGSVAHLVADFGALPPRYVADLLGQLLAALEQIHTAGVVHRDVKPANLLLEATGTGRPVLRLADFGIAIALGEPRLTVHGTVVGTPGYLAPEALAGSAPAPHQDLYAAGITAYQLLTGQEPPARGFPELASGHPIWDLVADLTRTDPADRPESASAALAALEPVLAEPLVLPAETADGELIEVFDHLPPLPDGSPYATVRPTLTLQGLSPKTPTPNPGSPAPAAGGTASTSASTSSASAAGSVRGARRSGWGKSLGAVVGAVGVVGAVVGGVMALRGVGEDEAPPVGASPSPEESTTGSGGAVVTRSAEAGITVGDECGWQDAGAVETAADGTRVECRQQGSSYRWVKVS